MPSKNGDTSIIPGRLYFKTKIQTDLTDASIFSSPEHEVLMVSYCGQSMSVMRRLSCGVNNCFKSLLLLHPGLTDLILGRKHRGDL